MTVTVDKPTWGIEKRGGSTSGASAPSHGPAGNTYARREAALHIRERAAQLAYQRPLHAQTGNGDEDRYASRVGNFSKGLPHNRLGEVDPYAYHALLHALRSRRSEDFAAIPLGGNRPLTNPQAGLGFDLEGPDSHALTLPPAPTIASAEEAGEMVELYWMALLRDVNFTSFGCSPLANAAAESMSRLSDFRGPKVDGRVTPATLFRGFTPGDLAGPLLSQFMLKPIPYGSLEISQRQHTVLPEHDYGMRYDEWLAIQNGRSAGPDSFDPTRRYIRNMRDLGQYVHVDALYEAYLNAALILLGLNAPVDEGNPYKHSRNQMGFGTFGGPHILSLVTEVATRALKAVWYQKWFVQRRLRPEAFAGLVHNHTSKATAYPLHCDVVESDVLERVARHNAAQCGEASHLLPLAFPEGSPLHPAYGAGHATVAGACVTILKAWFDESWVLPDPVVASDDGTELLPYRGSDAGALTVGGELNKVAANIAVGRNMAGVHWRSDYVESTKLGERVALGILEEQSLTYNEPHSFSVTRFDGTTVRIEGGRTTVCGV